jgi:hypothetical protein
MSLAIVLLTAQGPEARRTKYAIETVDYLRRHLVLEEPIWWHVADDGSDRIHTQAIEDAIHAVGADAQGHAVGHLTTSDSHGQGYGPNFNAGRKVLDDTGPPEFVLYVEDDWRLARPLDLTPFMAMMRHEDFGDVGMVRLSYMAYTKPVYALFRWDGQHHWLELRRDSEEPFIYSGNPRLEHWAFSVGMPWTTPDEIEKRGRGSLPGEYELEIVWRMKVRPASGRTEIVWPLDFIPAAPGPGSYFEHFGTERSFIHGDDG